MNPIEWADPSILYGLALVPLMVWWRRHRSREPAMTYSTLVLVHAVRTTRRQRLRPWFELVPMIVWSLLVVAMARPRETHVGSQVTTEGIDIVLALDISRSMMIEDMSGRNRLDAAKDVAERFVRGRASDRVGLVVFAGRSFTQCPLTVDYDILIQLIRDVRIGMVEDGTAIGMGLVNSINRLRESQARSKVIVLLTDGQNNRGEIDPLTAADIARALGIRVYTIGAGKDGFARIPVDDPFFGRQYVSAEVKIDEPTLTSIAGITGGQFFRATSQKMLEEIYDRIGQLEKTKIDVHTYVRYRELYPYLVLPALLLLVLYEVLRRTYFFTLP